MIEMFGYILGSLDASERAIKDIRKWIRTERGARNYFLISSMLLAGVALYEGWRIREIEIKLDEMKGRKKEG